MEARPNPTSAMPIGVIEKMSRPALPERSSRLSASKKAGALTRVRVVPSEAAKDNGISSSEADSPLALATRDRKRVGMGKREKRMHNQWERRVLIKEKIDKKRDRT